MAVPVCSVIVAWLKYCRPEHAKTKKKMEARLVCCICPVDEKTVKSSVHEQAEKAGNG